MARYNYTKMTQTHIIYIPGLGDGYDGLRRFFLLFWRVYGVNVEFIASRWSDGGMFELKMQRIVDAAMRAHDAGHRVVLIGESAGGSMVLNVYAEIPGYIDRVVTLCGKNTRPDNVSPALYRRNESFRTSMQQVGDAVQQLTKAQRQQMTSIYPFYDPTVSIDETFIPDCRRVRLWSVGHLISILVGLSIGSFVVVREALRHN